MATIDLAKQLSKRGHTVHIITLLDKGLAPENFENGYYIHRVKNPFPKIGILSFWINILKKLRSVNPDIIHLQGVVVFGTGIPVLLYHLLLNKPYIVNCHGFFLCGKKQCLYQKDFFSSFLFPLVIKHAGAIIVLTEYMKKHFLNWPDKKIITIPNCIEISKNFLDRNLIRKELLIKDDEHILLFVGRLHEIKGLIYLVSAMKVIHENDNISRLIIVGNDQGQRKVLDDLIAKLQLEKNISFIPETSHEKVFRYMRASDIFILPSLSEGFPMVLLEAMSSGIPIIASDTGGISEIVRDSWNGFLVRTRNPEDIAEKTLLLLNDNSLRKKISENNLADVQKYTWDTIIPRIEQIYQESL